MDSGALLLSPRVPKGTGTPLHLRAGPAGPVKAGSTCSGPQVCPLQSDSAPPRQGGAEASLAVSPGPRGGEA